MTVKSESRMPKRVAGFRISRRPPSKRSAVTEHQARHLVQLVRLLEREALSHFHAPAASRLPTDRFDEFFKLEAYRIFIEGAYACGPVCGGSKTAPEFFVA